MTNRQITAFVALDEGVDPRLIESSLPIGSPVQIAGILEGFEQSWAALEETSTDLLIIGCSQYSERALYLIEGAVKQRPDRPVAVLYTGVPNGFMQRAFEAGADDLIMLPTPPHELLFALQKVMARRRGTTNTTTQSPMICVLGPKGGTGKTLTAVNLAVALGLQGRRAVVVDLDLQFGDVGLALGLAPDRTIYDLATSGGTLDPDKVDSFLLTHPSGARALLAPVRPDQAASITTGFLRDLFATLRANHDFVVIDTPPAFSPEVIAAIDNASHLCVVGMLDALSLKDTKIGIETLALMGYDGENVRLVLNRADTSVGITPADVRTLLGREPDILVPSDRAIPRAITDGQPIIVADARSGPARAFKSLAELYVADAQQPEPAAQPNSAVHVNGNGNGNGRPERRSIILRALGRGRK